MIGALWFDSALVTDIAFSGIVTGISGYIVALMPRTVILKFGIVRILMLLLCVVAAASRVYLAYKNASLYGEMDITGFSEVTTFVVALVVRAVGVYMIGRREMGHTSLD